MRMETIQADLERKHEELRLLNACLRRRLDVARPRRRDQSIARQCSTAGFSWPLSLAWLGRAHS